MWQPLVFLELRRIMNQCHFLGNLVRDPDLRTTNSGKQVVNFTIAINRYFKRGTQRAKETAFLDCEAWDTGAATISKYFTKGEPIIVHGGLKQDEWDDKQSGQKRTKLKLRVERFEFVPGRGKGSDEKPEQQETNDDAGQDNGDYAGADVGGDDIPF
jgi:single-strand DNA-binding protein